MTIEKPSLSGYINNKSSIINLAGVRMLSLMSQGLVCCQQSNLRGTIIDSVPRSVRVRLAVSHTQGVSMCICWYHPTYVVPMVRALHLDLQH